MALKKADGVGVREKKIEMVARTSSTKVLSTVCGHVGSGRGTGAPSKSGPVRACAIRCANPLGAVVRATDKVEASGAVAARHDPRPRDGGAVPAAGNRRRREDGLRAHDVWTARLQRELATSIIVSSRSLIGDIGSVSVDRDYMRPPLERAFAAPAPEPASAAPGAGGARARSSPRPGPAGLRYRSTD